MIKLIILDYCTAEVHIYLIDKELTIDEDYIEDLGFNTNSCSWMFGENISIEIH